MTAKVILLALVLALAPGFAFALTLTELDVNAGLLFIGSAPPQASGITQTLGASLLIRTDGPLFLFPSIDFLGTYYDTSGTRAVLATVSSESGTSFFTIGALLGLQAGMVYPVAKDLEMGGAVGLDLFLRFPLELQNTTADTADGFAYFYGMGRFIFPETRFITRWDVAEGVTLVFTLRGMYPVFHIWDEEGLPFYDQLLAALDLGFVIRLGGKPTPAPAK